MPKIVDADARRAEILAALWRVVDRDGAQAVSVRSVASEAGWSKSSIAHYFDSQGALLALAIEQSVATVSDRILSLDLLDCTPDIAVRALTAIVPDTARRRRQASIWLVALPQSQVDPTVRAVVRDLNDTVRDGIRLVLTALQANHQLSEGADVEEAIAVLHAAIDGMSLHVLTDPRRSSRPQQEKVLASALRPYVIGAATFTTR